MVSWIGPSKPRRSADTLSATVPPAGRLICGDADRQLEVLRLPPHHEAIAIQRAAAQRQVFHRHGRLRARPAGTVKFRNGSLLVRLVP